MASSGTPYAPQIKVVELLERGKAQETTLPIYRDGALVTVSAVAYSLYKPDETTITDGAAGTYPGNVPTYNHSAGDMAASLQLGEGYLQEWTVTIGGNPYTFRRLAAIVRKRLYPVISDVDLFSTYKQLSSLMPSTITSYQDYIDEAWYTIIQRMRQEGGGLEYLVMSSESFRAAHLSLSLYYIFRDFHSSLGQSSGRYLDLANEMYRQYLGEWKQINFIYDSSHDGFPGEPNTRRAKQPVIFLNRTGSAWRRW